MAQPITSVSVTTNRGGGNKPQRHNNPGNIKWSRAVDQYVQRGPDGKPLADEKGHLIFATIEDGWAAFATDIADGVPPLRALANAIDPLEPFGRIEAALKWVQDKAGRA